MTPISSHFCLEKFNASATAKAKSTANVPNQQAVLNITALCISVLEPSSNRLHDILKHQSCKRKAEYGGDMSHRSIDLSLG